jgi:hypothetical protein
MTENSFRCSVPGCSNSASISIGTIAGDRFGGHRWVCGQHRASEESAIRSGATVRAQEAEPVPGFVAMELTYCVFDQATSKIGYFLSTFDRKKWLELVMEYGSASRIHEILHYDHTRLRSVHTSYLGLLKHFQCDLSRVSITGSYQHEGHTVFDCVAEFLCQGTPLNIAMRVSEGLSAAMIGHCPFVVKADMPLPSQPLS